MIYSKYKRLYSDDNIAYFTSIQWLKLDEGAIYQFRLQYKTDNLKIQSVFFLLTINCTLSFDWQHYILSSVCSMREFIPFYLITTNLFLLILYLRAPQLYN